MKDPVRILLGVGIPHLYRVFHMGQYIVVEGAIRGMVEQAKLGERFYHYLPPARKAMATKMASATSLSEAPAFLARFVCASMQ